MDYESLGGIQNDINACKLLEKELNWAIPGVTEEVIDIVECKKENRK